MKGIKLLKQINDSFKQHTGQYIPCPKLQSSTLDWIDQEAPFSLLAHNASSEPNFIYANNKALNVFGYSSEEMLQLQSKFSASEVDREERARLLQIVKEKGFAKNYQGPRVKKNGESFNIYQGMVWVVYDEKKQEIAQAALFWLDEHRPEWFNI